MPRAAQAAARHVDGSVRLAERRRRQRPRAPEPLIGRRHRPHLAHEAQDEAFSVRAVERVPVKAFHARHRSCSIRLIDAGTASRLQSSSSFIPRLARRRDRACPSRRAAAGSARSCLRTRPGSWGVGVVGRAACGVTRWGGATWGGALICAKATSGPRRCRPCRSCPCRSWSCSEGAARSGASGRGAPRLGCAPRGRGTRAPRGALRGRARRALWGVRRGLGGGAGRGEPWRPARPAPSPAPGSAPGPHSGSAAPLPRGAAPGPQRAAGPRHAAERRPRPSAWVQGSIAAPSPVGRLLGTRADAPRARRPRPFDAQPLRSAASGTRAMAAFGPACVRDRPRPRHRGHGPFGRGGARSGAPGPRRAQASPRAIGVGAPASRPRAGRGAVRGRRHQGRRRGDPPRRALGWGPPGGARPRKGGGRAEPGGGPPALRRPVEGVAHPRVGKQALGRPRLERHGERTASPPCPRHGQSPWLRRTRPPGGRGRPDPRPPIHTSGSAPCPAIGPSNGGERHRRRPQAPAPSPGAAREGRGSASPAAVSALTGSARQAGPPALAPAGAPAGPPKAPRRASPRRAAPRQRSKRCLRHRADGRSPVPLPRRLGHGHRGLARWGLLRFRAGPGRAPPSPIPPMAPGRTGRARRASTMPWRFLGGGLRPEMEPASDALGPA